MKTILINLSMFLIAFSLLTLSPKHIFAQDADGDGHTAASFGGDDCDDGDSDRFPGNSEVADRDNHDEDCDPTTVGTLPYDDKDGDGYLPSWACNRNDSGGLNCGQDCNDNDPAINPDQIDICNYRDDNCDGNIDEDQPCHQIPIWIDQAKIDKEEKEQQDQINEMKEKVNLKDEKETNIKIPTNKDGIKVKPKSDDMSNQNKSTCFNAIQGKIAWDQNGTQKQWSSSNIENLCEGAEQSTEPAVCFKEVLHGETPTGSGVNEWNWSRATKLCKGTTNASSTITCFKNEIADGKSHEFAVRICAERN